MIPCFKLYFSSLLKGSQPFCEENEWVAKSIKVIFAKSVKGQPTIL